MIKRICLTVLLVGLISGCVFYPVMPQADVDARHTALVPTITIAPVEATATQVVIEATLEATPAPECLIKGNINSRGEHIFHVPGGVSYNRTIVDPEHGEVWFCSEEEAIAAGFRKALR
jgi:hypothetical protein